MSYWAINSEYYQEESGKVTLLTKRKVSISKDDQTVLFGRDDRDLTFTGYTRIDDVKSKQIAENQFQFTLVLDEVKPLADAFSIHDLAFSLKKVYRFQNPVLHFRRKYVSLMKADFETILKGRIFWSRSAFGLFANAMTKNQYVQFIQESVPSILYVDKNTSQFVEGWRNMKEFVLNHFVEAAELLTSIKKLAGSLENDNEIGITYDSLQLSDDETTVVVKIKDQEELFADFVHSLTLPETNKQLFSALDEKIEANLDIEKEFEDIFKGESWLIHPPVNI